MKGPDAPPPAPDPRVVAQAQGEANVESAIASALLNQQGIVGPEGTVRFEQTGGQQVGGNFVPQFTRITELTPEAQAQFEAQQALGLALTGLAQDQTGRIGTALGTGIESGQLPSLTGPVTSNTIQSELDLSALSPVRQDFGEQARELEEATFQRGLNLLDPVFTRQEEDLERRLVERGLPIGSEAAEFARAPFRERRQQALNDLALQSVGAGRAEQGRLFGQQQALRSQQLAEALAGGQFGLGAQNQLFNQNAANAALSNAARAQGFQEQAFERSLPINDIAALLGTSPGVAAPQFQATPAIGVQSPDIIGATLGSANIASNNFAAQQQARSGLLGGLFGLAGDIGSALITR